MTIARQIDEVDIEAGLGQLVHPRLAPEREIERSTGRVGGTVHEEQGAVRTELRNALQMLITHVDRDALGRSRDHRLLGGHGGCGPGRSGT